MNPYKKLLGNSALFAIGNLGSRLISIILVPLYTYQLTTAEYGHVDIVTTTTNLILPIVTLSIYEAVLRFIMDQSYDEETILTNGMFVTIIGTCVLLFIYPILKKNHIFDNTLNYMFIIIIFQSFQTLFSQYTRAIGNVRYFALNGIITSFVTSFMNIVLLVFLKWGINGYLISIIVGTLVSIVYLGSKSNIIQHINFSKLSLQSSKKMLKYSIPLIPNSFMWWIMNASNRFFIFSFVGASANGLFAVASKIPTLLSIMYSIFFQAWQLSAIEEYRSDNKSNMYSNVFNYFSFIMFMGTSLILVLLKHILTFLVHPNYYESWKLVPFLLLGVAFSSFSGLLGTNYIVAKETKGVFKTSIIGGVISIITNLIFIPLFGASGAGISTMISFLVIWLLRVQDTKKYIKMNIDTKNIVLNISFVIFQIIVLFLELPSLVELIFQTCLFLIVVLINKKYFLQVYELFTKQRR